MNREHLDILMNRAIDGKASPPEREELARALLADPTLRAEYDELTGAHLSTVALFERLELPEDFTSRVMRKVQPDHVPTDADLTAIIEDSDLGTQLVAEPEPSPAPATRRTALLRRQATVTTILSSIGAFSAAAALFIAIGFLTGIIGSNKSQPQPEVSGNPAGGPSGGKNPAPVQPAPKRESGTPGEARSEPGVPDSPKPKMPDTPAPKVGEEEEDKLPPVEKNPPKEDHVEPHKDPVAPKEDSAPRKSDEPSKDGANVEGSESKPDVPKDPGKSEPSKEEVGPKSSQSPNQPENTDPQPKSTQPAAVWGNMLSAPSGRVTLLDESGKPVVLDSEVELRVGMKLSTSANCVSVFNWRGGGHFAAGRRTTVILAAEGFAFESGEMAVDFYGEKNTPSVAFGGYALSVKSGMVLLEYKTAKKVAISQSSGQSVLKLGEQTLVIEAGAQVAVEFGKMPASPKLKPFVLPEWCGVVRREISLAHLEKQLASRKLSSSETTRLQDQIVRMGRLPHKAYALTAFMNRVLEIEGFAVKDLIAMLGDIEEAFQANQELTLDETIGLATMCTCEVKNYADWYKRFSGKLREFAKRDLVKEGKERKAEEEKRAREGGKEIPNGKGDAVKDEKKVEGDKALDRNQGGNDAKGEQK